MNLAVEEQSHGFLNTRSGDESVCNTVQLDTKALHDVI